MNLGADPEFALGKKGKDGVVTVIAPHLLGVPHKTAGWTVGYGSMYRDGYSLEAAPNPSTCRETLTSNLGVTLQEALNRIHQKDKDVGLFALPTIQADMEAVNNGPEDIRHFGCEPAFSAYNEGRAIPVEIDASTHPLRYTGGHMHFCLGAIKYPTNFGPIIERAAFDRNYIQIREEKREKVVNLQVALALREGKLEKARELLAPLVRQLDLSVGLLTTVLNGTPAEAARRRHYGKAGEFRLQTYPGNMYGIEYRVPSSVAFIDVASISLHYLVGRAVVTDWLKGSSAYEWKESDLTQGIINEARWEEATEQLLEGPNRATLNGLFKGQGYTPLMKGDLLVLRKKTLAREGVVNVAQLQGQAVHGFSYWRKQNAVARGKVNEVPVEGMMEERAA